MPETKPYRQLAQFYDAIFTPWRAPVDRARNTILARILPRVHSACDLGCGTGTTALQLAAIGIETFAVDLSPDMCRLTRAKARAAGTPVKVIQADMRSFRLPHPVDLIVSECDAVNHVPRPADLARVARSAFRALKPGGWFYFEVNNAPGFRSYWNSTVMFEVLGAVVVMRNGHTRDGTRAWSDIDWFLAAGGRNHWTRHRERVDEVSWTAPEVRGALTTAGFSNTRAIDAEPFYRGNPFLTRGCRTFWLARR